jgi:hypothetical protein
LYQRQANGSWVNVMWDKRGPYSTKYLRLTPSGPDDLVTSAKAVRRHFDAFPCQDEPRTRYKYKIRVRFSGRGHEGVQNIEFYHWSNEVTA